MENIVLLVQCPDQRGIVAKLTNFAFAANGNITNSNQYTTDPDGGQFFMRLEFHIADRVDRPALENAFRSIAEDLRADWNMHYTNDRPRMALAVSRYDHCLVDILYRWSVGELPVAIPCIVSNHEDARGHADRHGVPFHHIPMTPQTRARQEAAILEILRESTDFLVLARYMQILSRDFLDRFRKPVINIHHSFLPSFKGASPYRQAYERGVKLIGATAHYATSDLDEGPIIEQVVGPVTHRDTPETLRQKGRHLEQQALAKALQAHIEHRIIRYRNKTIVFE